MIYILLKYPHCGQRDFYYDLNRWQMAELIKYSRMTFYEKIDMSRSNFLLQEEQ